MTTSAKTIESCYDATLCSILGPRLATILAKLMKEAKEDREGWHRLIRARNVIFRSLEPILGKGLIDRLCVEGICSDYEPDSKMWEDLMRRFDVLDRGGLNTLQEWITRYALDSCHMGMLEDLEEQAQKCLYVLWADEAAKVGGIAPDTAVALEEEPCAVGIPAGIHINRLALAIQPKGMVPMYLLLDDDKARNLLADKLEKLGKEKQK